MSERDQSIDAWKGIAIVSVIGIHACSGAAFFPRDDPNQWVGLFSRSVFNFAVALFFAISGFLSPSWEKLCNQGIFNYYYKRLLPIWIPYILWTFLYILIIDHQRLFHPLEVLKSLFLGTGIIIGYFVIVLTSLILIHPLLARLGRKIPLIIGTALSLITLGLIYWLKIEHRGHPLANFQFYYLPFTLWIVFFYLGFFLHSIRERKIEKGKFCILIAATLSLSLLEGFIVLFRTEDFEFASDQVKLTSFLCSSLICVYALHFGPGRWADQKFLLWLGRHSYALYLCHLLFLSKVSQAFDPFFHNLQLLDILISTALTTVTASIAIYLTEKYLPKPLPEYILGVRNKSPEKNLPA